jgi:hypothetical protein
MHFWETRGKCESQTQVALQPCEKKSNIKMTVWKSCVLLLAALAGLAVAESLLPVRASSSNRYLYDSVGRVRLFQGINMVTKNFPWYDPSLLDEATVADLAANGYNVIRLGLMWTGAEPSKGAFNNSYYAVVNSTITLLARHGIYTLLDMHQDGLSSLFCLYDGAPLWVVKKSQPRHAFPWPLKGTCARPWAENELTEAAGQVLHPARCVRETETETETEIETERLARDWLMRRAGVQRVSVNRYCFFFVEGTHALTTCVGVPGPLRQQRGNAG